MSIYIVRKYHQGIFKPKHPEKYIGDVKNIVYRSSWELRLFRWCDNNKSVLKYSSEELVVPYYSNADSRDRRYFVDMVIQYKHRDGSTKTCLVEVKPECQTVQPQRGRKKEKTYMNELYDWQVNCDKWTAATAYAEKNGMTFVILTEYDLGIKKR